MKSVIVDIHSHIYPPSYMDILRSRTTVPYVRTFPDSKISRLIILPGEDSSTARGRPIGPEYYDISEKIRFMDQHNINTSILSLANPWLDFVAPGEAAAAARTVNDEVESLCKRYPGRLYAFGTLPLSAPVQDIVDEIKRLSVMEYIKGIVMGTTGLGRGLDDERLDVIYASVQQQRLPIFLHPHYGLPASVYGPFANDYGHVLPLALGFPLETTIAVSRMFLSGVWDRFPQLAVLLAHSGGTIPFLAGRIESCIAHERSLKSKTTRDLWQVLRENIYLDGVVYSEVGLRAAVDASGVDRIMFGTDHPFFPPIDKDADTQSEWLSVQTNLRAIEKAFEGDDGSKVLGANAIRIFELDVKSDAKEIESTFPLH